MSSEDTRFIVYYAKEELDEQSNHTSVFRYDDLDALQVVVISFLNVIADAVHDIKYIYRHN